MPSIHPVDGRRPNPTWLIAAVLLLSPLLSPGGTASADSAWSFYSDNDFYAPESTDRDYSFGGALNMDRNASQGALPGLDPVLGWLEHLVADPSAPTTLGWEFGILAFTPEDITQPQPILDDRPYASLIYLSATRHRVDEAAAVATSSSLTVGVLGLNLVPELQDGLHELINDDPPRGWDNQISDGGEPTFRYLWERRQLRGETDPGKRRRWDWTSTSAISVGYLTEIAYGVNFRYGRLFDPWWSLHQSPSGLGERVTGSSASGKGWYLWGGASVRARAYNVFQQGQFRDNPIETERNDLRPLIGLAQLGLTWQFTRNWRLSYYLRYQSSEVDRGLADRHLIWGGTILTARF